MKGKLSTFQMVLYGFLVFMIILGVIIFSLQRADQSKKATPVDMWGVVSENVVKSVQEEINKAKKDSIKINYTEFSEENFEKELIEALAAGNGPDLVFLNNDLIIKHQNKLYVIGYDSYPQKYFKDTFVEAGDILLNKEGVVGLPYILDPLVLYWNRSMLNSAGISKVPEYWDQVIKATPQITKANDDLQIQKSTISFGEFRNVENAKDIILTLVAQAGNQTVLRNEDENIDQDFKVTFADQMAHSMKPAEAALAFFTQFSNPSLDTYSWNRSLPNSREMFLAGDLAFYVGYASEFLSLQRSNPNLNFDVAVIPQSRSENEAGISDKKTLGSLTFIGLINSSDNLAAAFETANLLTSSANIEILSTYTNLPPVRRDLLQDRNENSILQAFYESAIITKPFLDPDHNESEKIFSDMIESYTSGRSRLSEVIDRADNQLIQLIN